MVKKIVNKQNVKQSVNVKVHIGDKYKKKRNKKRVRRGGSGGGGSSSSPNLIPFTPVYIQSGNAPHLEIPTIHTPAIPAPVPAPVRELPINNTMDRYGTIPVRKPLRVTNPIQSNSDDETSLPPVKVVTGGGVARNKGRPKVEKTEDQLTLERSMRNAKARERRAELKRLQEKK